MLENLSYQDILDEPKFKELYVFNKFYIYKAINAKKNDKFFSPNKHKVLILKDEQEFNLITDTIRVYPVSTNISNQDAQAQYIQQMKQVVGITDFIAEDVPENTFYIISEQQLDTEKIIDFSTNDIKIYFVDFATGSDFKFHKEIKGTEDWQKKVRIIATLKQVQTYNQTLNSRTFVFHSKKYTKFVLDQTTNKLKITTRGLLGRINVVEADLSTNEVFQRDFTSDKPNIIIQADANQVTDTINLICSTFDKTKFLPIQFLKLFFNKKASLKNIWILNGFASEFTNAATKPTAATELYQAMLSIIFFSRAKLTDFNGYRITDTTSANYNKIDVSKISGFVYGVVATENLTLNIEELNAHICAFWEQKWNIELASNDKLKDLYNKVKVILLMSGTDVPSPYSYGSYDDINKLVADFYFAIDTNTFNFDAGIKGNVDIVAQVFSEKYKIAANGTFDVSDNLKVLSRTNVVDLRNSYTLPQIPKRFIAKDKNTRPQNTDLTTNELFSYYWYLNIKDQSTFLSTDEKVYNDWIESTRNIEIHENILQTFSFTVPSVTERTYERPQVMVDFFGNLQKVQTCSGNCSLAEITWTDKTISSNDAVKDYFIKNILPVGFEYNQNFKPKVQITKVTKEYTAANQIVGSYIKGATYILTFTWQQRISNLSNIKNIKFPLNLNVNTWNDFKNLAAGNIDEQFVFSFPSNINKKYLKELSFYGTFETKNYSVDLFGVLDDGSIDTTPITIEWPSNFQDDQSIIENGLIF